MKKWMVGILAGGLGLHAAWGALPAELDAEARAALATGPVHLVPTSLALPDGDGLALARSVREAAGQAYVPVIVVSGDAQQHLEQRRFTEFVTDYFDKALGHEALATFIRGYVQPEPIPGATILYVEDSRVVAEATKRMLERQGLRVVHVLTAEDAFALLTAESLGRTAEHIDLVETGGVEFRVETVELLGAERLLYGKVNGEDVTVRVEEGKPYPKPGETARIAVREDRLHWFNAETGKRV